MYAMVWSDFKIPQFFIVENSKRRINFIRERVTTVIL